MVDKAISAIFLQIKFLNVILILKIIIYLYFYCIYKYIYIKINDKKLYRVEQTFNLFLNIGDDKTIKIWEKLTGTLVKINDNLVNI